MDSYSSQLSTLEAHSSILSPFLLSSSPEQYKVWIVLRLPAILKLMTVNFEAEEGSFYLIDLQFYVIEQMMAIEIGIFIYPSRIY